MIDTNVLRKLWPQSKAIDQISARMPTVFAKYDLNTRLRIAHFMAQISHESGGGTIKEENLNYTSAKRLMAVWPRRFNRERYPQTAVDPVPFIHNPQKLANQVYNSRMGNRPGSDDGWNYRGRGLLQLTGREGYRRLGQLVGLDLEGHPELAADPAKSFEIAAAEFKASGCLPFADKDDITSVTKRVNGGLIGLDSRKEWLMKWKAVL